MPRHVRQEGRRGGVEVKGLDYMGTRDEWELYVGTGRGRVGTGEKAEALAQRCRRRGLLKRRAGWHRARDLHQQCK